MELLIPAGVALLVLVGSYLFKERNQFLGSYATHCKGQVEVPVGAYWCPKCGTRFTWTETDGVVRGDVVSKQNY